MLAPTNKVYFLIKYLGATHFTFPHREGGNRRLSEGFTIKKYLPRINFITGGINFNIKLQFLKYYKLFFIKFKHTHKSCLWYFYATNLTHSLFTFLLFFKKFFLSSNIATITLSKYIFSNS